MSVGWLVRSSAGRSLVRRLGSGRADDIAARVAPHLRPDGSVIDIGAGGCQVAARLVSRGLAVTAVDVHNWSVEPTVVPQWIDGVTLPFSDDAFAVALLITVLHHAADPERVLAEAARVARRVVVMEDIHDNQVQRVATMAMDSIVNLEFRGHPHGNRSDPEWRATFARLGLYVVSSSSKPFWRWFDSGVYVLERRDAQTT